jgi:hypothetical protein
MLVNMKHPIKGCILWLEYYQLKLAMNASAVIQMLHKVIDHDLHVSRAQHSSNTTDFINTVITIHNDMEKLEQDED